MFGIVFGLLCLVALFAVLRRGRNRHGFGHWNWGPRAGLNELFDRLGTSNTQEKTILAAAGDLQDGLHPLGGRLRDSRRELSQALRGEQFDADGLNRSLQRHETDLAETRQRVVAFLATVHETLDPGQRQHAARLLERGWTHWGHHGGCHGYRHAHSL